jgi:hypothetical protein
MYRDQDAANTARIARLSDELEEAKRTVAEMREELAELRRKYARARSVLAMIAHTRKVQNALEDVKTGPEELAEMMASPSNRPPPMSEPPAAAMKDPAPSRKRRSSAGRYILINPDDDVE